MATIPIEVIVQDAEAPIVPSEDGTNTNTNTEATVAVPDTGSGIGNIFTGSASAIVLPAILLVLAIGSIVAILIHKYYKQKKNKSSKKEKLAVVTSSTIAVLAATVLLGNLILPATKAATSDTLDTITPAEDKISIVVTRDGGVAEESIESTATITSTSDFGYKVLISMAEGVETSNLYLNGDTTSEHYIAATESAELVDNTWGYALEENGEYAAVPLVDEATIVAQGDEPVETEDLSIYYGVKVSSSLPAGTYSGGEIEYTLEAKEPTISITYMQDFNTLSAEEKTNLVSSMPEGYQFTLKDNRDQKDYFVSKLADGNVWMTQNLDLDIEVPAEGSIVYDSTNTNLPASTTWEPERATIAKGNLSSDTWQDDNNNPYSYDPGDVYYYTSGDTSQDKTYESLTLCMKDHTEPECKHYHAGNYYNWSAAVASNDTSEITQQYTNVDTSICPAGWRLPKSRNAESPTEDNEQITMITSYEGILDKYQPWGAYDYLEGGFNAIRTAPLWLARSGGVYSGSLSSIGHNGYYWSSTANFSSSAFSLYFNSYDVDPASSSSRYFGYSVRCVAQ